MNKEDDISRFANIGDALKEMRIPTDVDIYSKIARELTERSTLYLEFLAAAFLQETGLKASETEMVISYGIDKVTFSFRRRENVNNH